MRRALLAAVLLPAVSPQIASAAPLGAPDRIGLARPADHRDRPGALSEVWTVRVVDPRSKGWLEITVARELRERSVEVFGVDRAGQGVHERFTVNEVKATRSRLDARGRDGGLAIRAGGRRVALTGPLATGGLRLRRTRRGPAAYGWHLGAGDGPPPARFRPVTLNWSMAIATSTTRGALQLRDGRRFRVDGWRASYEHRWGDILLGDRAWEYWNQAVVHDRRGAWIAYGLNRSDTVTGDGARDAQWLGVLARVRGRGARVCRPAVIRRGWRYTYPGVAKWSTRASFRCHRLRLKVRIPIASIWSEYETHNEFRNRIPGRTGLALNLAHDHG
jgi:hypothetical protein